MITYNIQLAGDDFIHCNERGTVNVQEFIEVVFIFPWKEQVERYNELKQGCSPTISAVNEETKNSLWISALGTRDKLQYLVGYVHEKRSKRFLGLIGKTKVNRWVDIYLIDNLEITFNLFQLFFNGQEEKLQIALHQEEKYKSMLTEAD